MLKTLTKRALGSVGLQLARLPRKEAPSLAAPPPLQFGPYVIHTDCEALRNSYACYPETNRVITRIVETLTESGRPVSMVDIGANCGDSAALAKVGGPVAILCVEGDAHLSGVLRGNLAQMSDVEIRPVFLGEAPGQMAVKIEKAGWNTTLVADHHQQKADVIGIETLDNLLRTWEGRKNLRFIKCDTEGFDVRILFGARETLAKQRPVVLFEYSREAMAQTGETGFRIFAFLRELEYDRVLFYDAFGRFICTTRLTENDLLIDLHEYADGVQGKVYYYDVVAFPAQEEDLGNRFVEKERRHRKGLPVV